MSFSKLQAEYSDRLIGEGIYEIVRELSGMIARKYPESIYNDGLSWDGQSIDDICQEVVLNQLLGQKQIHYIFDNATTIESVRRLLTGQIKRALSARRKKTPVDRLLKRISDLSKDGLVEFVDAGVPFYRLSGSQNEYQPLGASQVNSCVRAIAPIPRLDSRLDTGRESMIYTPDRLKTVMETLFRTVSAVTEKDLRSILEVLLTPWAPASLVPVEKESIPSGHDVEDSIEEEQMATDAQLLVISLTHEQRLVLVLKSQNISDALVAAEVGVSRPTVADMKKTVLSRVGLELIADLPADRHERAMQYLLEECNSLIEAESK
jgi:predicted XRE-type DNA-binding protein